MTIAIAAPIRNAEALPSFHAEATATTPQKAPVAKWKASAPSFIASMSFAQLSLNNDACIVRLRHSIIDTTTLVFQKQ
jgi:hypothetical protein